MMRHFQLTLMVSAEDLIILTTYLEHAYDKATADKRLMPRPLARRLREIASAYPADAAFEYLVTMMYPTWEISAVGDDTVTIATTAGGASVSRTLDLLGRLAPSCLAGEIVYAPIERSDGPNVVALH